MPDETLTPIPDLPDTPYDVAIVGAGLSGLTAAYLLSLTGLRVALIEKNPQPGGLMQTRWADGYLMENGPHTFLPRHENLLRLLQKLNLQSVVLEPQPTSRKAKNRYIYQYGELKALPTSFWSLITSDILSKDGQKRLMNEMFEPSLYGEKALRDESVSSFIERRLGPEVLAYFVAPFISGIYAGNPDELSAKAVFPKLVAFEQQSGSLTLGALKAIAERSFEALWVKCFGKARPQPKPSFLSGKTHNELLSFEGGMQSLVQTLVNALPPQTLCLGQTVRSIQPLGTQGYGLALDSTQDHKQQASRKPLRARSLILATPADVTADLLASFLPEVEAPLKAIPYVPLAVVHFGFKKTDIAHKLDGFGQLIPRQENLKTLGTIWTSSLFPDRAPAGHVLLTSYLGGATLPQVAQMTDLQVIETVLQDLRVIFGLSASIEPVFCQYSRYARAIPQYTLGHLHRVSSIQSQLATRPGLYVTGNYLQGVSLNDCVQNAMATAEQVKQFLQSFSGITTPVTPEAVTPSSASLSIEEPAPATA